ncbi:MAG: hypothetical protein R2865_10490 [Deinococcales bacterium]
MDNEETAYPFYCEEHTKVLDEEDYLLPVVNSPRMGVCAYTGAPTTSL